MSNHRRILTSRAIKTIATLEVLERELIDLRDNLETTREQQNIRKAELRLETAGNNETERRARFELALWKDPENVSALTNMGAYEHQIRVTEAKRATQKRFLDLYMTLLAAPEDPSSAPPLDPNERADHWEDDRRRAEYWEKQKEESPWPDPRD